MKKSKRFKSLNDYSLFATPLQKVRMAYYSNLNSFNTEYEEFIEDLQEIASQGFHTAIFDPCEINNYIVDKLVHDGFDVYIDEDGVITISWKEGEDE